MEYPQINEVVICKIIKITDFGVFAELLEFENAESFIHISQVSSTWVKNIHNHVKINQIKAARVLKVDESKRQIDLSFSRVTDQDEKRKVSDYRLFLRAQGLLNVVAKENNISQDDVWQNVAEPIFEKESSLYKGFVNIIKYGIKDYAINKEYAEKLISVLSKNITIKDKEISGVLKITSNKENGVELIKNALLKIEKKYSQSKLFYFGPGKYELKVTSKDYKLASKYFDNVTDELSSLLKKDAIIEIKKKD